MKLPEGPFVPQKGIFEKQKTLETYEEFEIANRKVEAFVDSIEKVAPNHKIDIADPYFWQIYRTYIENLYDTKVSPYLGNRPRYAIGMRGDALAHYNAYEERRDTLIRNAFAAEYFTLGEHVMRLKTRTLLNALKARKDVSPEAIDLLQAGLPSFYRADRAYLPRFCSFSILEKAIVKEKESLELLLSHRDKEKIEQEIEKIDIVDQVIQEVNGFMMFNGMEKARSLEGFAISQHLQNRLLKVGASDLEVERIIKAAHVSNLDWHEEGRLREATGDSMAYSHLYPIGIQIKIYEEQLINLKRHYQS